MGFKGASRTAGGFARNLWPPPLKKKFKMEVPKYPFLDFWNLPGAHPHDPILFLESAEGVDFMVTVQAAFLSPILSRLLRGEAEKAPKKAKTSMQFFKAMRISPSRIKFEYVRGGILYSIVQCMYARLLATKSKGPWQDSLQSGSPLPLRANETMRWIQKFFEE